MNFRQQYILLLLVVNQQRNKKRTVEVRKKRNCAMSISREEKGLIHSQKL